MIVDGIQLRHVTIYVTVKPSYSLQHDCHAMSWPRLGLSDDSHRWHHSMRQEKEILMLQKLDDR